MAIVVPYKIKSFTFSEDRSFSLESGEKLGPITVAYETFGELNEAKDNAILVTHALTGDSHVTSAYDDDESTPGWWDSFVGPGKPIDSDKYFVICSNILGGCMGTTGPASINPETEEPYGLDFPSITVGDMAAVQKRLIDHLGIERLHSVIGGSLGGMIALELAVVYPDLMESLVLLASAHRTSPLVIAFYEVGRNAILADPNFCQGRYYDKTPPTRGLSIARMIAHITYLSKDSLEMKFGRDIKEQILEGDKMYGHFGPMFQVESYLRYQGRKFVTRFDANSYLYITKAMDLYDITRGRESLGEVLSRIKCKMLVASFETDWHFSPQESWEVVKAMMNRGKEVSYVNMSSPYGHDAFLIDNEELARVLSSFIKKSKNSKSGGDNGKS